VVAVAAVVDQPDLAVEAFELAQDQLSLKPMPAQPANRPQKTEVSPVKASTRPAAHIPERASAVLILVMVWVSVVVGTRTGSIGQLSAAWLAVVAAAAGPGACLLPAVCQREPDLGGEWRVVGVEVGEEGVPA